jgi:hypothetical protein
MKDYSWHFWTNNKYFAGFLTVRAKETRQVPYRSEGEHI